jgi:hypothetical protein
MSPTSPPPQVWPTLRARDARALIRFLVDALHARAADAGAEITRAPQDTDYGSREFALRDPEGNTWSFGTYRGHAIDD